MTVSLVIEFGNSGLTHLSDDILGVISDVLVGLGTVIEGIVH